MPPPCSACLAPSCSPRSTRGLHGHRAGGVPAAGEHFHPGRGRDQHPGPVARAAQRAAGYLPGHSARPRPCRANGCWADVGQRQGEDPRPGDRYGQRRCPQLRRVRQLGRHPVGRVSAQLFRPATTVTGTSLTRRLYDAIAPCVVGGALIGAIIALALGRDDRRLRNRDEIADSSGSPSWCRFASGVDPGPRTGRSFSAVPYRKPPMRGNCTGRCVSWGP